MEKVTVNLLAEEFEIDSKTILKELKKIGVMVFSANQPIDPRFEGKVRAHLKLLSNLAQEEEKRAERKRQVSKKRTSRSKPKKPELAPLEPAISRDMTIRKARKTDEDMEAEEAATVETTEEVAGATVEETAGSAESVTLEDVSVEAQVTVSRDEAEETVQMAPDAEETVEIEEETPLEGLPYDFDLKKSEETVTEEKPKKEKAKGAKRDKTTEAAPARKGAEPPKDAKSKEKGAPIVREIKKEKKKAKVLKRSSTGPSSNDVSLDKNLGLFSAQDSRKRKGKKRRRQRETREAAPRPEPVRHKTLTKITLPEGLSVKEVAERLEVPPKDILKNLFMKGIMVNINQILDMEVLKQIGVEFGFDIEPVTYEEELFETEILESDSEDFVDRPPVITVMGHVDHGKTSLLDAIRNTFVADREAGGITQHIGAYMVNVHGRRITFIDTPGHEAFTMMRARGAKITDIVILVVAADDGVMPQTVEAIQHARAANVPILVAINKIDKPNANTDRVKQALAEHELIPEEWGGSTVFVEVSAKKMINIDQLLEMVLLVADMQDISANPNTKAMGTVIESRLDKSRGTVATLLVQNGTLFERDIIVAGAITGKIRAMYDENNNRLDEARPSTPVMVLGLDDVPEAGERFFATDDATKARQLSVYRQEKQREEILNKMNNRVSLDTFFKQLQEGQVKELPIILKVDVQGSKDAIESMLNKLSTDKVKINILFSAVGAITENDVLLASASNAIIVGFNVKPVKSAEELAEREKVDIRFYNVIYHISDEIRKAMEGLLEYTNKETVIGTVAVRDTFRVPGVGTVIGAYVTDGMVRRDAHVRLFRDGVLVHDGRISSLKRFKEDVTEVKTGYECGIGLERYNDIKVNDELQIYTIEKVKESLDS